MNLSYFIAKRIAREQQGTFSSTIHKIAIVTITVGLGAAIVSFLIMTGFQRTIKNKIYGFSSHLTVTKFTMNNSAEEQPFFYNIDLYKDAERFPIQKPIQEYAHKAGLIKTPDEVMGVMFKGVGKSFSVERFKENIIEGEFIHFPDSGYAREVMLSRIIADKIHSKVGDEVVVHFFQNPPRFRKLKVTGIYETNLSEYYDSRIIIGDLRMVQRLNDWADSVAGGMEVFVDFSKFNRSDLFSAYVGDEIDAIWESDLNPWEKVTESFSAFSNFNFEDAAIEETHRLVGESMDYDLFIEQTRVKYYQVFEWLGLINRQVMILLAVILIVVCVNMISVVLILVMERTQMVGMLKALGAKNRVVRSVFVFNGINLIVKGLIYGNVLGLGVCYLQDRFKFIKLNAHDYYMSYVPVGWNWEVVIVLNLLVFVVVTLVLLIPTAIASRVNPIKAIRFD